MTPFIVAAALSILALDATPSTSQPTTTPAANTAKSAANGEEDMDKVICRKEAITVWSSEPMNRAAATMMAISRGA